MTATERIKLEHKEKTGKIDLSGLRLTEIPKKSAKMTWLKELNLSNNKLSKIQGQKKLTKPNELNFFINKLAKTEGLDQLKSLNILSFPSNSLTKIKKMELFTEQVKLYLHSNQPKQPYNFEFIYVTHVKFEICFLYLK